MLAQSLETNVLLLLLNLYFRVKDFGILTYTFRFAQ